MKKEEERVRETMINGYLCALSHYNVHVHVYRCKCNNYAAMDTHSNFTMMTAQI